MTLSRVELRDLSPMAYAMTRIAARFTGATIFSPGTPLAPVTEERAPRQFQYPIAVNLAQSPRRDYPNLTPFETLRQLCKQHNLAALCIRVRMQQLMALHGSVVAKDAKAQAAENPTCDALDAWFSQPDGLTPRASWIQMLMRDVLEIDAPTIYKRPDAGGRLVALDVIDGSTIKPLLDDRGRVAGYQQIIYGLALSQYLGRRVKADEEEVIGEFAPGELWYQPYSPSTYSPYGRPPMEDLLVQAQIYLQKQGYDLAHFTDGNIPGALGIFNEQALDIDQVASFEQNFNAVLQGDIARGSKIKFIPFPIKIERMNELSTGGQYESAWEESVVKLVCAMFGVTPTEVGFTADVNRATADAQENVTYRIGIRPPAEWLKETLFDPIIQRDFGQTQLEWRWDFGESEDRAMLAQTDKTYYDTGSVSSQELRSMRYPDLAGNAPGPPAPPAAPAIAAVAKREDEENTPPDAAERARAEGSGLALFTAALASQFGRLKAWIAEHGIDGLGAFWATEPGRVVRELLPFYDKALRQGAAGAGAQLGVGVDWDLVNDAVLQLAHEEATRYAVAGSKTAQAQAARIIEAWIQTGGDLDELTKRLELVYSPERAKMTAITEVTRLYAQGNHAAWEASGVVTGYTWQTAHDERVCPVCGPLQGTEYPMEDEEHLPPAHPNCRCWISPVVG